jgi:hypothetical protein
LAAASSQYNFAEYFFFFTFSAPEPFPETEGNQPPESVSIATTSVSPPNPDSTPKTVSVEKPSVSSESDSTTTPAQTPLNPGATPETVSVSTPSVSSDSTTTPAATCLTALGVTTVSTPSVSSDSTMTRAATCLTALGVTTETASAPGLDSSGDSLSDLPLVVSPSGSYSSAGGDTNAGSTGDGLEDSGFSGPGLLAGFNAAANNAGSTGNGLEAPAAGSGPGLLAGFTAAPNFSAGNSASRASSVDRPPPTLQGKYTHN